MSDTPNVDNIDNRVSLPKPDSRIVILQNKKERDGLAPEEEGELRGLFAHPDNPTGQALLKNEYLASLGLAEMSEDDRERLRLIRVETYRRNQERDKRLEKTPSNRDPQSTPEKPTDSKAELNQLHIIHTQAKIATLSETLRGGSAKEVIDGMIDDIPDDITVYTKDTLGEMPKDEPSPLELFLLGKIRELPDFDSTKPEGSLGALESIACLRDSIRTKKFVLGLKDVVATLDTEEKSRIDMIDAGCGALPIMAIYAALSSEKVHCTALELNPNSAEIARRVIAGLGLQDRIKVLEEDATIFRPEENVDLLVSETIHSGLTQEPMVQIMSNLSRFVKSEGVTLPSRATVQAAFIPFNDWVKPEGYVKINKNLHHYVTPDWQPVTDYKPGDQLNEIAYTTSTQGLPSGSYFIMLTSEVDIGNQHLGPYQSLITTPQVLRDANSDPQMFVVRENEQRSILVKYKPGETLDEKAELA